MMNTVLSLHRLFLLFSLTAWSVMSMAKEAPEVGLITQVVGEVTVAEGTAKAASALPFVKLRSGTRIAIPESGRFQVVYLNSGRQETWGGSAQLEIGEMESKPVKVTRLPAVKQLPAAILRGLTQAPIMIADMRSRQGMIRVRAAGDWARVEEAEKSYKAFRAQAEPGDVTPELFLLATLSDLKLYDKMKQPMDEMLARQPGNESIRALHESYTREISSGGAGR